MSAELYRASAVEKPLLRGVLHSWCTLAAIPAGVFLILRGTTSEERFAAAIFSFGAFFMFLTSALFHRTHFDDRAWYRFRRVDHTAIFMCICCGATPFALLALDGWVARSLLFTAWLGASAGIAMRWLFFHPPHGLMNATYIVLGWGSLAALPQLWGNIGAGPTLAVAAGGFLYTVGALIVGARWPDPWPLVFGYHEIWHLMVLAAIATHWGVVAFVLL